MKIEINPVDLEKYVKFVERYNSLNINQRRAWQRNVFPDDKPELFASYDKDGVIEDKYMLIVVPIWMNLATAIVPSDSKSETRIEEKEFEDYVENTHNGKLFQQDLKIQVMHTDFKSGERRVMRYSEFLDEVKDYLGDVFSSDKYAKGKNTLLKIDSLFEG